MKYLAALILCSQCFAEGVRIRADHVESDENGRPLTRTAHGTAFFVTKNKIVTAWHNLEGKELFFVEVEGSWFKCKLERKDKDEDLALLSTVAESQPVEFADIPYISVSGSQLSKPVEEHPATFNGAMIRCYVNHGDSGSPVMAEKRCIGMVKNKIKIDSDHIYAEIVSANVIKKFVEK